jgi:hypothetical protein
MTVADWLQLISLGAVIVALLMNYRQNREVAKQAKEASQQTVLLSQSVRTSMAQERSRHGTDWTYASVTAHPDLIAWFLSSRGLPSATDQINHRYAFLWARLDYQELRYFDASASQWTMWCGMNGALP